MYLFEGCFFRARHIKESDAEFIFKLRKSDRAYGLNPISDNINDQIAFIKNSIQGFHRGFFRMAFWGCSRRFVRDLGRHLR